MIGQWSDDVYFDQRLCAVHSKYWLKFAFSMFLCWKAENEEKARNLTQNLSKNILFKFASEHWLSVLLPEKYSTCLETGVKTCLVLPVLSFFAEKTLKKHISSRVWCATQMLVIIYHSLTTNVHNLRTSRVYIRRWWLRNPCSTAYMFYCFNLRELDDET